MYCLSNQGKEDESGKTKARAQDRKCIITHCTASTYTDTS